MTLENLVYIYSGRTFKNGVPESDKPTHSVVQLRDFDKDNDHRPIKWEQLCKTDLSNSKTDNSLKQGDILMVAKGPVKKAICLNNIPKNVVANQHFFVMRVKSEDSLSPDFFAHFLNSKPAQQWMSDNSGGSYQSTISKTILSKLPFPDISLEKQTLIAEAVTNVQKEIFLHERLIKGRRQEVNEVFRTVWGRTE